MPCPRTIMEARKLAEPEVGTAERTGQASEQRPPLRIAFFRDYAAAVAQRLERDPPDMCTSKCARTPSRSSAIAVPRARIVFHTHDELLTRLDPALMSGRLTMSDALVTCSDCIEMRLCGSRRRCAQSRSDCRSPKRWRAGCP
jgi:hypothetical protein